MNQQLPPETQHYMPLPTSGLAIASLVTGILGFMGPVVFSIVALITGYAARKETRAIPPAASGDGLATAGIVMAYVQLGLAVIILCCAGIYFLFTLGLIGALGGVHSH